MNNAKIHVIGERRKKKSNNNLGMFGDIKAHNGPYEIAKKVVYICIHYYGLINSWILTHSYNHNTMMKFFEKT
jgi:hypothetical protein